MKHKVTVGERAVWIAGRLDKRGGRRREEECRVVDRRVATYHLCVQYPYLRELSAVHEHLHVLRPRCMAVLHANISIHGMSAEGCVRLGPPCLPPRERDCARTHLAVVDNTQGEPFFLDDRVEGLERVAHKGGQRHLRGEGGREGWAAISAWDTTTLTATPHTRAQDASS